MKLLLDTHVVLWWLDGSPQLGTRVRKLIADEANQLRISFATPFELAVKVSTSKLKLDISAVLSTLAAGSIIELAPEPSHYAALSGLPMLHRDPFDRMIIAQAVVSGSVILTNDAAIRRYPVRTVGCD